MLMSLTMRCLFMPPADSRGTTSDVAIPIPSFSQRAERSRPVCGLQGGNHFNYTAALARVAAFRPFLVADMVLERDAFSACSAHPWRSRRFNVLTAEFAENGLAGNAERSLPIRSRFGLEELGDIAEFIIS